MTRPPRSHPADGTRVVWRTRDVAASWQRTPTTIQRWVDAGDHPAPRTDPGGQPFWLAEEVEAFARGGDPPTPAPTRPTGEPAPLALVIGDGGAS